MVISRQMTRINFVEYKNIFAYDQSDMNHKAKVQKIPSDAGKVSGGIFFHLLGNYGEFNSKICV